MKVSAIKCNKCGDIVFSRARHDFRECSCRNIFIDGGFDYIRVGFSISGPERIVLDLEVTKEELYDDWNKHIDKFGIIKNV